MGNPLEKNMEHEMENDMETGFYQGQVVFTNMWKSMGAGCICGSIGSVYNGGLHNFQPRHQSAAQAGHERQYTGISGLAVLTGEGGVVGDMGI